MSGNDAGHSVLPAKPKGAMDCALECLMYY